MSSMSVLHSSPSRARRFSRSATLPGRATGPIPAELLARHVLSVTTGAGWPVQRAAMEAVLRRIAAARQDRLCVARAPRGRRVHFTTRRDGAPERPYATVIEQVDPLRASCDCRDFVRNSLGLCKHVLTVLAESVSSTASWPSGP